MSTKEDKFKGNSKMQLEKARARGDVTNEEYEIQKAELEDEETNKKSKKK
jgi:uncharacterized membrane protein